MKLAISGKGGAGKTTLTALLCLSFASEGKKVLAIDADPTANLAGTLNFPDPEKIIPVIAMSNLIEERTGAKPGTSGSVFKLNPKVDDIPEKYSYAHNGIKFMVLGAIRNAGAGCACPENTFLKSLLQHLVLERDEVVIVDMEAGIEHLGRGTLAGIDALVIVVEPGRKSLDVANRVFALAKQLGLKKICFVANKVRNDEDLAFISKNLPEKQPLSGSLPYSTELLETDRGMPLQTAFKSFSESIKAIINKLGT